MGKSFKNNLGNIICQTKEKITRKFLGKGQVFISCVNITKREKFMSFLKQTSGGSRCNNTGGGVKVQPKVSTLVS